jgi:hypothetical protein
MDIKVTQEEYDVSKAVDTVDGSPYQLEEITEVVQRGQVKPGLLRALLNPASESMTTDTYKYDEVSSSSALPSGKSFSGYGPDLTKDKPRQMRYAIPSFGLRSNVRPEDYAGRRKPGTANEFLTEADVVAAMTMKSQEAWDLFDELAIAQLLTLDTNIVRGGPFEEYNFYTDITGGARAAKVTMDLATSTTDHEQLFRQQRKLAAQELARSKDSATGYVVICGDNFFDQRYEIQKNEGLARPIRFGPDLASQPIAEFQAAGFNFATFDSQDGLTYINYGSQIIAGSQLIADDDAYLIPVGASQLMSRGLAPAQTRQYVNTPALDMYGWSKVDDRQGVTTWTEQNALYAYKNPRAVQHLVV